MAQGRVQEISDKVRKIGYIHGISASSSTHDALEGFEMT